MHRRHVLALMSALVVSGDAAAETALRSASVEEAHSKVRDGQMVLIDVRTPQEWAETGSARGAVRMDMADVDFIKKLNALKVSNPGREIGLICRTGNRSAAVQVALSKVGHGDVVNVRGGMSGTPRDKGWLAASLPLDK